MKDKLIPLTPSVRKLVDALCDKAQGHGLLADQGSPDEAAKAKAEYEQAKLKLEKSILSMQKSLRKARQPFRKNSDICL